MRLYESVFIARQDVSTTQVENLTTEFSAIIENGGGKIHKHEYWGLRTLAYRVKKNRKGHYVMLNLETNPETLAEYERIMGLNEDVLRFINITIDEVLEDPSIMMQAAKSERGGRGDRSDRSSSGRNVEDHDETADSASDAAEEPTSTDDTEE
tara:strand:+ start:1182 stop:1640 length:459 start_codon:yes stop_codon:yes gene_type:complete